MQVSTSLILVKFIALLASPATLLACFVTFLASPATFLACLQFLLTNPIKIPPLTPGIQYNFENPRTTHLKSIK